MRKKQTLISQNKIKDFYKDLSKDVTKIILKNGKQSLTKAQFVLLQRDLKQRIREISKDIADNVTDSMITTANAVVADKRTILSKMGFKDELIEKSFMYVPDAVVRNIVNGTIYQDDWSLSKAIWGNTKDFNNKLSSIVARGTTQGKSTYDIAKELEQFVNPTARKKSKTIQSWRYARDTDVKAGRASYVGEEIQDKYYIGDVDYNAQRLARTMISHAYQQSFMAVNEKDPFVFGYRWLTSNFHGRICEWCLNNATQNDYSLGVGVFPKNELPLDHPNGMCTFEAVIEDYDKSTDIMLDWYSSPEGTYPEIDEYVKKYMY